MAFPADVLRSGVKIANGLTKGVQMGVTLEAAIAVDQRGKITYAAPVTVSAVVELGRKLVKGPDGQDIVSGATLTIVGDVAPNGATIPSAPRVEPIDPRDRVTLPDGRTAPIIPPGPPNSVLDPKTGRGFIHAIVLGAL